jgi:Flp pilus assembly protein TadD
MLAVMEGYLVSPFGEGEGGGEDVADRINAFAVESAGARAALERAIALAPHHAQYLSELGYLLQVAKDWQRSLEIYKQAEDAVGFISVPAIKRREQTRAMRGQGHALIELGDRDAAEQMFLRVLEIDPDDTKAKQVLEYIRDRKRTGK